MGANQAERYEQSLLVEAVTFAKSQNAKLVTLDNLRAAKHISDLDALARRWQGEGYGRAIHEQSNNVNLTHFSLSGKAELMANLIVRHRQRQSLRGRLSRLNWNVVNGISAAVGATAAVAAAYFAYLSIGSH